LQPTGAVKYGDEQFGNVAGGKFWVFHSAGVSIVNPDMCSLEKTLKIDANGNSLPTSWSDGVYMESSLPTLDDDEPQGHMLINSDITRFDLPPFLDTGTGTGEVRILSTNPNDWEQSVVSRIDVGGRPVHSYALYTHDQVRKRSKTRTHNIIDISLQVPPDLNLILCLESCLVYNSGLTSMPMDTST
jgi:hypothetical protein